LGDKWTLVIVKQMLLDNHKTFKDFFRGWWRNRYKYLIYAIKMAWRIWVYHQGKATW